MIRFGLVCTLCIVLSGCYSNQFLGTAKADRPVTLGLFDRFRVSAVDIAGASELDETTRANLLSYMSGGTTRIIKECNRLCDGDWVGDGGEELSLEIVITKYCNQMHTGRALLYFLSLGTLPALNTTDGEAVVRVKGQDGELKGTFTISFHQWGSVTCYTPFALFSTPEKDSNAQVNELTRTALFIKLSGQYGMMEQSQKAFSDTVAVGMKEFLKKGRADRAAGAGQSPLQLTPALLMTTPWTK